MSKLVRVLLVSGSTRAGSGNTAALVTAAAVSQDGTISDPRFRAEAAGVWDALLDYLGER